MGAVKLSPRNARQLRKASAAPSLSVPPTPCHRLSKRGGLLTLALPSWAAAPCSCLGARPSSGGPPATPATPHSERTGCASRRWIPIPQRDGGQPLLLHVLAPKAEPHPGARLLLACQAWGSDLWRQLVLKLGTLRPPSGPGAGRRSRTPLASAAAAFRRLRRGPRCAVVAGSPGNPAGERCCSKRFRPIPRLSRRPWEARPQPGRLLRGSPFTWPVGARAGRERPARSAEACVLQGCHLSATARSQLAGALAAAGRWAPGALACLGNQPAGNQPRRGRH